MKRFHLLIGILCLLVPLVFLGCEGDDGAQGPQGIQGPEGPEGPQGPGGVAAANPESCDVCHGVGQIRDVTAVHAVTWVPLVSNVATVLQADNTLLIGFNVVTTTTQNSSTVPFNASSIQSGYVNIDNTAQPDQALQLAKFQRIQITGATLAPVGVGTGNYTITVPAAFVFDNATYAFRITGTSGPTFVDFNGVAQQVRPVVVVDYNGRHLRDLVTSGTAANPVGCAFCHGPYPAYSSNFNHYAVGGADCQVCHTRLDRFAEARTLLDNGTLQAVTTARGANLTEYVHGIHNSHNMVGETYFRSNPGPGEDITDLNTEEKYSVGYPSDMRNCNVCHFSEAQREVAASAPVSYYLCMTCHVNWDGFRYAVDDPRTPGPADPGGPVFNPANPETARHLAFDNNTNCAAICHNSSLPNKDEASDFHNLFITSDIHLDSFYRGEDISFNNDDNVLFAITGVQKSGDNVTFTWTASKLNAAVNPCDNNLSAGPSFRGLAAQLAYAKGDDWVNENLPGQTAPGQPAGSRNLFGANASGLSTTCDNNNVATTTGLTVAAAANAYASKATLAVVGKPINRGTFLIGSTDQQRDYLVRSPSRTFDFSLADGSRAEQRRTAVDSAKCNRCHRGTLYQHGGERVDNEQLCVICHNPSSSEKNVRVGTGRNGYQIWNSATDNTVNTGATYDGKVAETYDMRYLIHAIHGAEKREKPIIIYRTRGIFAFAPPVYEKVGNTRVAVEHTRPEGWVDGSSPVFGSLQDNVQTHTWTTVHYPKPFNECIACHTGNEFFDPADQTKAVALTVDPGTSFSSQADDIVIGPTAAACTACHESAGPQGIPVQRHATIDFGYKANVAKEVMLEKAGAVALSAVLAAP